MEQIIEIARELNFSDLLGELQNIQQRKQGDCPLSLPLVGEFSSGKTTLINALTDSRALETATRPTTATIYEVHFGAEHCVAHVIDAAGRVIEVDDLTALKNDALADARVVEVYDTATKVSPSIVLVDTPGLSSPDPKHKQTLVEFLPQADALLLVSDINQQVTRSIADFLQTMKLSHRPICLVLTKCDTKSEQEIKAAKAYVQENTDLDLEQIVCVSAAKDDLGELYALFDKIQLQKGAILQRVNRQRVELIVREMKERIDELLQASGSDKEAEQALGESEAKLKRIHNNIDRLIEDVRMNVEDVERKSTRDFEDSIFAKLDTLVSGGRTDYDAEAVGAINTTATLYFNEYRQAIRQKLNEQARSFSSGDALNLRSLHELNLDEYSMGDLSYNLSLNTMGHQYDKAIGFGVKAVAAAAAVTAVVTTGGAAAAGGGALASAGKAMAQNPGALIDVTDTLTDVASIVSNNKMMGRMSRTIEMVGKVQGQMEKVDQRNQELGQKVGQQQGLVEGLVGFVTDKTMGKPQRRRAIHNYLSDTLLPTFKEQLHAISLQLLQAVSCTLKNEAEQSTQELREAIESMKQARNEQKQTFQQQQQLLKTYKEQLNKSFA